MDNDTTQPAENAADALQERAGIQADENVGVTAETKLADPATPAELAEEDARQADPVIRAWVRQNLSWLMAEIDHGRQGKTAEERTGLNP